MKNFTQSLGTIADIKKAYAQDLIPCADGSMADSSIGCVDAPGSVIGAETNITEIILQIASVLINVVMVVSVLVLILGGITYAIAAGNDFKIRKSKRMMMWSLIGLVVALLARTVVKFILMGL